MKKSFLDKFHKWDEKLVNDITRNEIKNYYEKNINKIFPYIKDRPLLIILGVGKNKFVLKRNINDQPITITKKYGIDDQHSFEYWINRRVIEFHPVINKRTNLIWVDIDLKNGSELYEDAAEWAIDIEKFFKKYFNAKVKIWKSGRKGIHIEGYLKNKIDVDKARKYIRKFLNKRIEEKNDTVTTTGIAKKGQIRLDISTLKNMGSIRAPWSFSTFGKIKEPI